MKRLVLAASLYALGLAASFAQTPAANCQFNAQDDQQERARYALLDWNVRISLKK